jgi:thiosulfate dehydrogenase
MKTPKQSIRIYLTVGAVVLGSFGTVAIFARAPFTDAQIAEQKQELLDVVNKGRDLWHGSNPSMSTNGLACGNCHPDAAASNPQTFPINWCIVHPQNGTALDVSGPDMVALEAYAAYLYRGEKIEPGYTVPTPPIPVKSGVGYPWKPSGVGVDK